MAKRFFNRVKVTTSTTGTGALTLGSAAAGHASFAEAGVVNGDVVTYCIQDGNSFEIGRGTFTAPDILSRDAIELSKPVSGSAGTTPLDLSGDASVFLVVSALDMHPMATVVPITTYGAIADDSTNAAQAIQDAHDSGARHVLFPAGTYRVRPLGASPFDFENQPNDVFRCVELTNGNTVYEGWGARLHISSRENVVSDDHQYVFASNKEVDPKAVSDIDFVGIWFNPENNLDSANSNHRFMMSDGVSNLRFIGTIGQSTGNRRGYFGHLHNGQNFQIIGHRHNHMTGAFNFRFTDRVMLVGTIFDNHNEALDFDGRQKNSMVVAAHFTSTSRANQAMDINSNTNGIFCCISATDLGQIANVNLKLTTPDTYAEYIANGTTGHPVRNFPEPARNIIQNVVANDIGNNSNNAFYVGWDWASGSHAGGRTVRDLILQNALLENTTFIHINEGKDVRIDGLSMRNVKGKQNYASLYGNSAVANDEQIAFSDMDMVLSNIDLDQNNWGGIYIKQASRVLLENVRIRNINSSGSVDPAIRVAFLGTRGGRVKASNLDIQGNVIINGDDAAIASWTSGQTYLPNKIVANGGQYYRAQTVGRSAASGGPTGTGMYIQDDGTADIPNWAGSTAYTQGQLVRNGAKVYYCLVSGTSAATGGPATDDQRAFDGDVIWHNVAASAHCIQTWTVSTAYALGVLVRCNGAIYQCTTGGSSSSTGTGPDAAGTGITDNTAVWKNISGTVIWEHRVRPFELCWDGNNTINNGQLQIQSNLSKYAFGKTLFVPLGSLSATGNVQQIIYMPDRPGLVVRASFASPANAAANGSNYRTLRLSRVRSGASVDFSSGNTTSVGLTADTPRSGAVDPDHNNGNAYYAPGDVLKFVSDSTGTGVAISGLTVQLEVLEW